MKLLRAGLDTGCVARNGIRTHHRLTPCGEAESGFAYVPNVTLGERACVSIHAAAAPDI